MSNKETMENIKMYKKEKNKFALTYSMRQVWHKSSTGVEMQEKPRWKIKKKKKNAEDCKDQVPVQVQTDEMGEGLKCSRLGCSELNCICISLYFIIIFFFSIYFLQFDIATWAHGISTWLQSKKRVSLSKPSRICKWRL